MITANFKKTLAIALLSRGSTNVPGYVPAIDANGNTRYLSFKPYFPGIVDATVQIQSGVSNPGIWLGSSSTPASENDFALVDRIGAGLDVSIPTVNTGVDSNGQPYLEYLFTVTNTTANNIIISEIGYVQKFYAANAQMGSASSSYPFLLDRTIFDAPVSVPAGESAVIRYTLKATL